MTPQMPAIGQPPSESNPIRVMIQQPALPKYRIPVFVELARRPGLKVHVVYAKEAGLQNVASEGFSAQSVPVFQKMIAGRPLFWHKPQWDLATKSSCDVLVLCWNLHYASLIPALLRARANGVPTILWGHGYSKNEALWRSWPRRKVAELATALLFYNHTTANQYIDMGWNPKRIHVAINSLDQTPIRQARQHWLDRPDDLARFRREQKLSGPVILFVSRLEPGRRVEMLLKAMLRLRGSYPRLQLVILGGGDYQAVLQSNAQSMGLVNMVRFVGAIYDEMALAPWFLSADIFGFPAYMGLSLLHAFGYGLPVITSNHLTGHGPEIEAVRHGENGLLYEYGNADAMADAVRTILDNPQLRKQMSVEALRTVDERFTLSNMVDGFQSAIWYCAGRRGLENPSFTSQNNRPCDAP